MRPISSILNSPDSVLINFIFHSQKSCFYAMNQLNSNLFNLTFCKFCTSIIFTILIRCSIFLNHISHVVCMCTQKQVRRITASSIIAIVQYMKIVWDRAMSQKPCHSMRFGHKSFILKASISLSVFARKPIPTIPRIKFFDFRPESAFRRAEKLARINGIKRMFAEFTNSDCFWPHKPFIPQTL